MKIEYVKSKKEYPKLCEISAGTVFSPINSIEIYIKLDKDGLNGIFIDNERVLKQNTLNIQDLDNEWEDYSDIIAVTHLSSGTLVFMNRETRVNPLDCKLVVEE